MFNWTRPNSAPQKNQGQTQSTLSPLHRNTKLFSFVHYLPVFSMKRQNSIEINTTDHLPELEEQIDQPKTYLLSLHKKAELQRNKGSQTTYLNLKNK